MCDFRGFSEVELNREDNVRSEGDGKSIRNMYLLLNICFKCVASCQISKHDMLNCRDLRRDFNPRVLLSIFHTSPGKESIEITFT